MKVRPSLLVSVAGAVLGPAALFAAFAIGGIAFTKRPETVLLAEPHPLASTSARVAYAQEVKINELRGPWMRVTHGSVSGWVFAGNLAEQKPAETRGLDGLPLAASETTAAAAARPLLPAAEEYSGRRGLTKAAGDLTWLTQQANAVTPADVKAFLQEQKKGEHQ